MSFISCLYDANWNLFDVDGSTFSDYSTAIAWWQARLDTNFNGTFTLTSDNRSDFQVVNLVDYSDMTPAQLAGFYAISPNANRWQIIYTNATGGAVLSAPAK